VRWEEKKISSKYWSMVKADKGELGGVLIFDESGMVKKGNESAGGFFAVRYRNDDQQERRQTG
jgi:hypothetical protein